MTNNNSAVDASSILPENIQRANIWRLAIAQALAGANATVVYVTGAIVGNMLAPTPMLATLPISIFVVGMAACILPVGAISRLHGRRAAFLVGTGAGVLTGVLAMFAVIMGWFWLFCLATFFGGSYAAVVLSFRFAAADGVEPKRRARALSLVMAGGVAAGVVGPQLVTYTMDLWPAHTFAITFLVQAAVAAVSALILLGVGWNFGFLGASALVLECHRPAEKTRVQSFNDFIVFGLMAIGSFASGGLLSAYGWNTVLWVSFAPLLLAVAALAVAMRRTAAASMSQEDAA